MKWTEITISTHEEGIEYICGALAVVGINECRINEGRKQAEAFLRECAPQWDFADVEAIAPVEDPSVVAYIADIDENKGIIDEVKETVLRFKNENPDVDFGSLEFTVRSLEEEDWANNWKKYYKPFDVKGRLVVCPTWEKVDDLGDRKLLSLDPGMAFGSGLHETTRMCLDFLAEHVFDGSKVIDLGCGSGILSIAAHLLGASKLKAMDIDPMCVEVAIRNAELNGFALDAQTGNVIKGTENVGNDYDVAVANIVADVLIAITPQVPSIVKKGGLFISSGIIDDRIDDVVNAYKKQGMEVVEIKRMGQWAAVLAKL